MQRNKLLSLALDIGRILQVFFAAIFVLLTTGIIIWHISPSSLDGLFLSDISNKVAVRTVSLSESLPISELSSVMIYAFYLKYALALSLFFLITQQLIKVIQSLRTYTTFRRNNVQAFKRIGLLLLLYFFLTIPSVQQNNSGYQLELFFSASPLVGALAAYILAEIFKEGNKLQEDNKFTV